MIRKLHFSSRYIGLCLLLGLPLPGCQQPEAEPPVEQSRQTRIMEALKDYGDRDFRNQVDMNELQELARKDWDDQQASLMDDKAEMEAWAQDALGKWKDSQTLYGEELEKQLGENQKLIGENTSQNRSSASDPLKDAEWTVGGRP